MLVAEQDFELRRRPLSASSGETIGGRQALDWADGGTGGRAAPPTPNVRVHEVAPFAYGYFDHNFIAMMENVTDHLADKARTAYRGTGCGRCAPAQVVLATGGHRAPDGVFCDNDRPGIMTGGGGPDLRQPLRRRSPASGVVDR